MNYMLLKRNYFEANRKLIEKGTESYAEAELIFDRACTYLAL